MKRSDLLWGSLLTGAGVLLLLQNIGLLGTATDLFWMTTFAVLGVAFLGGFVLDPARWWPLIPGWTLLGLAGTIGVQRFAPAATDDLGGALFLGAIGLGFWSVFVTHRRHWWAIIPGGVLVTLAVVAGLRSRLGGNAAGGLFFLGLATTFVLIYVLPTPVDRHRWALIPAAILSLLSLVTFTATTRALDFGWPVALIAIGLYLLIRTLGMRPVPRATDQAASPTRTEESYDEPTLPQPH